MDIDLEEFDGVKGPQSSAGEQDWDTEERVDVDDELAELTQLPSFHKRIRVADDESIASSRPDNHSVLPDNASVLRDAAELPQAEQAKVLRQCRSIVRRFMAMKDSVPFRRPVDPVAYGIPDYFDIIKQPMDLGTIEVRE